MNKHSFRFFVTFLKKYIPQEILLIILMLLASVGTLISPYVLKIIIDEVFPSGNILFLVKVLAIYLAISLVRLIVNYASSFMFEKVSNNLMRDLRLSLYSHLLRLPLSFFDKRKTGDIIHRINSEVNSVQNVLTGSIVRIINSVCTLLGLTVMLCLLNTKLFLVSLFILPFIYVNTRYYQPKIHKNIKKSRQKDSEILSYLMERFRNIKMLKSYMSYSLEEKKLKDLSDELIAINLKNVRLSLTTRNISTFLTFLVPIIILLLGGMDVMAGAMTIGALVAFIQYINRLFDPMRDLMSLYFDIVRASVSMDRIYELISLRIEGESYGDTVPAINGDLEFVNVDFSYDNLPVLHNINMVFEEGKKYALVGESGCGKSTIINLLCRFYEPTSGIIKMSGKSSHCFDLESWRKNINLVTQDNHLFHDTILSNVAYANPGVAHQDIEYACQQSCIDHYISEMNDKYYSVIGDQGVTLSGGQKQRIAIARSLLKAGNILLLDEATAAVDSETEKDIISNIFKINKGKTIIMVSHRLSSLKDVDEIVCIRKGKIEETGTHDQLMDKRGYYWRIYNEQVK